MAEMDASDARGSSQPGRAARGTFERYKPEQGTKTRNGTAMGLGVLLAWGVWSLHDELSSFGSGQGGAELLVTKGIPIVVAVVCGAVLWWIVYSHRKTSDFMIATEGEMKKVSWSTRREVIGSTKVVVLFTFLLAVLLFVVDFTFKTMFTLINVLKT